MIMKSERFWLKDQLNHNDAECAIQEQAKQVITNRISVYCIHYDDKDNYVDSHTSQMSVIEIRLWTKNEEYDHREDWKNKPF